MFENQRYSMKEVHTELIFLGFVTDCHIPKLFRTGCFSKGLCPGVSKQCVQVTFEGLPIFIMDNGSNPCPFSDI